MLGVAVYFSCLFALSTTLPTPHKGFATAKHALIIGCDGLGMKLHSGIARIFAKGVLDHSDGIGYCNGQTVVSSAAYTI